MKARLAKKITKAWQSTRLPSSYWDVASVDYALGFRYDHRVTKALRMTFKGVTLRVDHRPVI